MPAVRRGKQCQVKRLLAVPLLGRVAEWISHFREDDKGPKEMKAFVNKGSTLLNCGEAEKLPIKRFALPVMKVSRKLLPKKVPIAGLDLTYELQYSNSTSYVR